MKTTILGAAAAMLIGTLTISSSYAQDGDKKEEAAGAVALFPEKLLDAEGNEVSRDTLKGKTIGLYFSASW